jgi:hypothetical protein
MSFIPGITIFKVNEPVIITNESTPGFDNFILYSIEGSYQLALDSNFSVGKTLLYSYSSEGTRTLKLEGLKNIAGVTYTDEKIVEFLVGVPPSDVLSYTKRSDQSSSYSGNYVQAGVCFQVDRIETTAGTEPKTYEWNYAGGTTYSSTSDNPNYMLFSSTGVKTLGLTTSNLYGSSVSSLNIISINTPAMQVSVSPPFGIVRTNQGLTLSASFSRDNNHTLNDVYYTWKVNGVCYETLNLALSYDYGITLGVTFEYSSKILTGLSGSTYGQYRVLEVPGIYTIYVSDSIGNDSWAGISSGICGTSGPVKTLAKATQLANGYTGDLDVDIRIAGGTYFFTENSFYLSGENSGNDKVISYLPIAGNKVVISGGYTLSPSLFTLVTAGNTAIYNRLKTSAKGNVYQADLSSLGMSFGISLPSEWNGRAVQNKYLPSIPDLFYNNVKMTVARWPNKPGYTSEVYSPFGYTSCAYIDSVVRAGSNSNAPPLGATTGIFKYSSSDSTVINSWSVTGPTPYDGIWIHGFWKWDWHDEVYKVISINKITREIEVYSQNGVYGIAKNNPCSSIGNPFSYANPTNRRWFAFNLLEELDAAGEYYLDRYNKKLYFWPPTTIGSTHSVVLSSIRIAGDNSWVAGTPQYSDSQLQQQSHLNTNAVNASLFKFYKLKNIVIDGLEFRHMSGSGIEMIMCENVKIKNCKIYSPRKNGIMVVGGKNNTIDGSEIYYSGGWGVILSGGNRQTLTAANNTLTNSKLIGCTRNTSTQAACILLTGVGNIISKNIISDSGSIGIRVSGNDHIIEYNNFTNIVQDQDDSGGIYIANNISDRNTTIRYNFFNNVKTALPGGPAYDPKLTAGGCPSPPTYTALTSAIYIDEFNSGVNVQSNVFYNCGSTLSSGGGAIFATHGLDHVIDNNIIIDSRVGVGHWYSNKSLWNTNSKGLKSGPANISVGALQQILNINDEPWYEDGSPEYTGNPPILFGGRNYNPYSFFASGYGLEGTYVSTPGLLNKVNITSDIWKEKYPQLADTDGMIVYNKSQKQLSFNTSYPMKIYITDNVFVNVDYETIVTSPTNNETILEVGDSLKYSSYDIFTDKNNLNFKLTPAGLSFIKESIPSFEDIPFENIPVI